MTLKELNKKCRCLFQKVQRRDEGPYCHQHHGPLSDNCHTGKITICKVIGDRRLCAKMASLGILPGQEAEVLSSQANSPCLLKIHGGTLSLDQDTSNSIIVQSV